MELTYCMLLLLSTYVLIPVEILGCETQFCFHGRPVTRAGTIILNNSIIDSQLNCWCLAHLAWDCGDQSSPKLCSRSRSFFSFLMGIYGCFIAMDCGLDELLCPWCSPCHFSLSLSTSIFSFFFFIFTCIDYRCSAYLTLCSLSTSDLHSHHWLRVILTYIND